MHKTTISEIANTFAARSHKSRMYLLWRLYHIQTIEEDAKQNLFAIQFSMHMKMGA